MKNFYRENRVFSILMIISIMCILVICGFLLIYFFNGQGSNKYGDRLTGINENELSKTEISDYKDKLMLEKGIDKAEVNLHGKIIYVTIFLEKDSSVSDGVNASLKTLDSFSEEKQSFYDFNFIIEKEEKDEAEKFPVMGYKNALTSNIVWTKY